jgi:hypothetical protein
MAAQHAGVFSSPEVFCISFDLLVLMEMGQKCRSEAHAE